MNYNRITINASSGTVTVNSFMYGYQATEIYTPAPITLSSGLSIVPDANLLFNVLYLRWNATVFTGGFPVTICGTPILQDQLNQTGLFQAVYDGTNWTVQYYADGKDQPQVAQGVASVTVPVGGTLTLTAGINESYQRLVGSPTTLTSNYTVTAGTTGIKAGSQFQIEIAGGIILGSNTLTVFGISINANQALNGGIIVIATFDGTNWIAASTSKPISTADLNPVTALSVMGNATNATAAPSNIPFSTDYGVLQRNGTTLTTGLLTASNFDTASVLATQVATVALTSTQIKNSNTAPITILPAPGVGRVNVISSILASCTFVSVAYTANLDVQVYALAGTAKLFLRDDLLGFTSSGIDQFYPYETNVSEFQNAENSSILLSTAGGNPLTGDGTIILRIIYQTINV